MALPLNLSKLLKKCQLVDKPINRNFRYKFFIRHPVNTTGTLESYLKDKKEKEHPEELYFRNNIGFKHVPSNRRDLLSQRLEERKIARNNMNLEKAARERKLVVPLDEVTNEWAKTNGPIHMKEAADYFRVFDHLFGDAYFYPVLPIKINFEIGDDKLVRIYNGNLLKPSEAAKKPNVSFNANSDELFTLLMVSPDGHLSKECGEYVHWLVGNIPGNDIGKGQTLVDYMQPFPAKGIGYCRYVFVLFRQENKLDFKDYSTISPCLNLAARDFSTHSFYTRFQEFMTPAGLAFFQSDWEQSLTDFFHHTLDMKEPTFEYNFNTFDESYRKEQPYFPEATISFDTFLDQYKEPKQLQLELLLEKLKECHPFEAPPKPPKYPLAMPIIDDDMPSWQRSQLKAKRAREGKWKFI